MLLSNYTTLNVNPGRAIGGFTNLYSNYKPGGWYSFYSADTLQTTSPNKAACFPTGTEPPYSWILAINGGEFSSSTSITSSGTFTPTMILTKPLESSDLSGSSSLSGDMSLLSQLVAAIGGTGSVSGGLSLALSLATSIAGTGSVSAGLSLLVGMISTLTGTGTLVVNLTGKTRLEASIFVNSGTATANDIAAAVWNALAADYNTSGTMGNKLNGAGSAGDPWSTDLSSYTTSGTAGKKMKSVLELGQFIALK